MFHIYKIKTQGIWETYNPYTMNCLLCVYVSHKFHCTLLFTTQKYLRNTYFIKSVLGIVYTLYVSLYDSAQKTNPSTYLGQLTRNLVECIRMTCRLTMAKIIPIRRGRQHSFVEIDHEIFSTVILSLPLIQERQLSVSGERMCTILINRLED